MITCGAKPCTVLQRLINGDNFENCLSILCELWHRKKCLMTIPDYNMVSVVDMLLDTCV